MQAFGKTLSGIVICGLLIIVSTASSHVLSRQVENIAENISDSVEQVRHRVARKKSA